MKNIFVYGTLKEGYENHHLIERSMKVSDLVISGFKLYESGIPYMKRTGNLEDKVLGEVYIVDDVVLSNLDSLEDHPDWYHCEVIDANRGALEGYVYLPEVHCKESPKINGVYVYGREKSW